MNKLVFIPQKEDYRPFPNLIMRAQFTLECFRFTLNLIHRNYLSNTMNIVIDKNYNKANYIFAVGMRCGYTTATFNVTSGSSVEVLGEGRTINITDGKFSDEFIPYGVHLYKINM